MAKLDRFHKSILIKIIRLITASRQMKAEAVNVISVFVYDLFHILRRHVFHLLYPLIVRSLVFLIFTYILSQDSI